MDTADAKSARVDGKEAEKETFSASATRAKCVKDPLISNNAPRMYVCACVVYG